MRAVIVEPSRRAYVKEIGSGLKSMQKAVGGCIQILYPFEKEELALVCNDEGKLLGLPLNRGLLDEEGKLYDIISGTFVLCRAPLDSEKLASLTLEQGAFCLDRFKTPELFLRINGQLVCLPLEERQDE